MKRNVYLVLAASLALAWAGPACATATSTNTTLTMTGTVESSISMNVTSTALSGLTSTMGNISKYGATVPTGFTRTRGASDWTLSTNLVISVDKANLTSADYSLEAQTTDAAPSGVTWKLGGVSLSNLGTSVIEPHLSYSPATDTCPLDIVIADSASPGAIDNMIVLVATAN